MLRRRPGRAPAAMTSGLEQVVYDSMRRARDLSSVREYDEAVTALVDSVAGRLDIGVVIDTLPAGSSARTSDAVQWRSAGIDPTQIFSSGPTIRLSYLGHEIGVLRIASGSPRESLVDGLATWLGQLLGMRRDMHEIEVLRQMTTTAHAERAGELRAAARDMEEVRRSLERDLHDGPQADLVAMKMHVAVLDNLLESVGSDAPDEETRRRVLEASESVLGMARRVKSRVESAAAGVVPGTLLDRGLVAALRTELPAVSAPGSLRLYESGHSLGRRFPLDVEIAAYFICFEAVTNVGKHAAGADVAITVDTVPAGLRIEIADTGPGLEPPHPPNAFRSIKDRAARASAHVDIVSTLKAGTTIALVLPY